MDDIIPIQASPTLAAVKAPGQKENIQLLEASQIRLQSPTLTEVVEAIRSLPNKASLDSPKKMTVRARTPC